MNENIVSSVFDSREEAERAMMELRSAGVQDNAISIIAQQDGKHTATDGSGEEEASDVIGKTALGAGVGALLGIAALAIPGVGPFIAAGAIAEAAVGGAAITGTAIGAAAGGLTSLLSNHGVSSEDAGYFEERINQGGVFVSVDTSTAGISAEAASDILYRAGGHSTSRSKMVATA
ncbi:hypothetical protein [Blastomonas sp.]|uniref:hypothetical protein n=1 Tax=Blastomonas sp. TaxID=1909299 RepID=UPI00359315ED